MPTVAERMMTLFAGFAAAHGTHGLPTKKNGALKAEIKSTAQTLREPVTVRLWELHLTGKKPLGVIPIMEDGNCLWGSIDYDVYDTDLLELVRRVEEAKLPLVPCRSKSGGLHLWLFLAQPTPAAEVLPLLRHVAAAIGIAGSEIFPKQTQILVERGDTGNWMVMPYFGDTYGGLITTQAGLKKTGAEMTVEEFLSAAEKARVTPAELAALSTQRPRTPAPRGNGAAGVSHSHAGANGSGVFSDGPPCLQHLAELNLLSDGRKRALFMCGLYAKRANPSGWKEDLEAYNRDHMHPPLPADEVTSVKRSLSKKEYHYTCRVEPMASHCNSTLCRTRKFGVGEEGDFPRIGGLSVLATDPPLWFVDVDDDRVDMCTEDLINYRNFHRVMAERRYKCYRPMKQDDWLAVLAPVMRSAVTIEAPPDVGRTGRFFELLEEFLTNRNVGHLKDDLLSGRPYEDEEGGRYYFRLRDVQDFCERAKFFDMDRATMTQQVKNMGGNSTFFNIKNRGVNVWWVPRKSVQRIEPLDTPKEKRAVI